ncbi:MAG: hypothetical protein E6Q49_02290 [Limnohabitans sp.]|nr:MAG: hypothetical protein E6Q49_02290 [Limnohabitans sp.]
MTPNLQIEYRPIDALLPYARNPRTHSPAQIAKIAASIVEFGWTQPILVDGDNGIIAGHGRLAAARTLELVEVPVIELGHLSPAQKRAYVIADNRLALEAGWDDELLALELAELSEAGYDLVLTGFDDDELAKMLADLGDDGGEATEQEADPEAGDVVPEPPKHPISRPGDVWQLGPHRLICGDASDPVAIATLLQASRQETVSYLDLLRAMRRYCGDYADDARQLWRRLVFNLLITNVDDHLQNLGFVYAGQQRWRLAPAFDLNPFPHRDRVSRTPLNAKAGRIRSVQMLLDHAGAFEHTPESARQVLKQVVVALSAWRDVASSREIGMPKAQQAHLAPAFEHEQTIEAKCD